MASAFLGTGTAAPDHAGTISLSRMERPFIVHLDPHLLVVDKPAGLPSVPGRTPVLQDCAASRVQALYGDALVVHRLDMATSGLLLFARGLQAQRVLNRAFEERRVEKAYVAVVRGRPPQARGSIALPLIADWPRRPRQIVDHQRGKPSLTHWELLEPQGLQGQDCTRVQLRPVTGRSHQLRVHLAAIGHPILGDDLYADEDTHARSSRLLLHATALAFPHPDTGQTMNFHSAAPF
jgi:tRNA pseudouridine32 synthase / 23S rRNA pseudouridine746 synthase